MRIKIRYNLCIHITTEKLVEAGLFSVAPTFLQKSLFLPTNISL